jgi:hypothetical protein
MKLRDIVAEFLADLTRAQHRTNELSKRLSDRYRNDRLLRFFPVPNALLDEASVTLRFAPIESGAGAVEETPEAPSSSVELHPLLALRMAQAIAAPALKSLAQRLRAGHGADEEMRRNLAGALTSDAVVQKLSRRLQPVLQSFLERAASVGAEEALVKAARQELARSLAAALQEDKDFRALVSDLDATVSRALGESEVRETLVHGAAAAHALTALPTQLPAMDVAVDGPTLANFPEHAIQTITLKAKLRNYKWVIVEDRDGKPVEEDLLPEQ